jgi:hypothetical protein
VHAALFTGQRAVVYAPELDLVAVAGLAPASELAAFIEANDGTTFGSLLRAYAVENTPGSGAIDAPVLIVQGTDDVLIRADIQRRFVQRLCALGQQREYREFTDVGRLARGTQPSPPSTPVNEAQSGRLVVTRSGRFGGRPSGPSPGCTERGARGRRSWRDHDLDRAGVAPGALRSGDATLVGRRAGAGAGGVDRGTPRQQGVGQRGPAVVGERSEQCVGR